MPPRKKPESKGGPAPTKVGDTWHDVQAHDFVRFEGDGTVVSCGGPYVLRAEGDYVLIRGGKEIATVSVSGDKPAASDDEN